MTNCPVLRKVVSNLVVLWVLKPAPSSRERFRQELIRLGWAPWGSRCTMAHLGARVPNAKAFVRTVWCSGVKVLIP